MPAEPPAARLEAYLEDRGEDLDVAYANLLVAQEEYPEAVPERYLGMLDELAAELRPRIQAGDGPREHVARLNHFLFEEKGFRGNLDDYYDPRNSYLNQVLERRLGIPITLSLVYIQVGRRLQLPLQGIGMPGHFLVAYAEPDGNIMADPFNQGRLMSLEDCRQQLRSMYGDAVPFRPGYLQPILPRQMLARMLANLKIAYLRLNDHERTLRTIEHLLVVTRHSAQELRDRGLVRARLGHLKQALADLDGYLAAQPSAEDAQSVRETREYVAQLWERRN